MASPNDPTLPRAEVLTRINSSMRREHRLVCERALELVEWATRNRLAAKLIDYSENGMGLVVVGEMPVGSQFLVEGVSEHGLLVYLVKSCNEHTDLKCRVGAELCGYVTPEGEEYFDMVRDALRTHCPVVSIT